MRRAPDDTRPDYRRLRIYAIDPMVERGGDHHVTAQIRFEELPLDREKDKDPISLKGARVEVVDVDVSGKDPIWLKPVDLDDPNIAAQQGLEPLESDPQFHQQMVYAVAMRTLEQFDRALGRVVYFRGRRRLRLVPHAFRGANAFYHPDLRAVLFGWFRASESTPGENLPGQTIFTCLSHDIVAHEVTHAIVDRLRPHFNVATNPHVRAFHEAFADIVAVFQRLTFRDLVQRALQDARGDITRSKLLSDVAAQFGQGLGNGRALRTALDQKTRIQDVHEEHELGAVLVAAVFDGFERTYQRRCSDLVRIATGGTGVLPEGALHPDLVGRLTTECVRTAQSVLTMCVRAIDYLPPADVTFGAFLRALVTADWELNPLDETGQRAAMIEACRLRGIFATDAGSLAVGALLLDAAPPEEWKRHRDEFRTWVDLAVRIGLQEQRETPREDNGEVSMACTPMTGWSSLISSRLRRQSGVSSSSSWQDPVEDVATARRLGARFQLWFHKLEPAERAKLGMREDAALKTILFHPSHRIAADGTLRFGLTVQLVDVQSLDVLGEKHDFPSGATLVIDGTGDVRFVIRATPAIDRKPELEEVARRACTHALGWKVEGQADPFAVDYRGMHEVRTS